MAVRQAEVDTATEDTVVRLRSGAMTSVGCKEAERILDSNYCVNDELLSGLQQAWDCAIHLDCQLCQVERPGEVRNHRMQQMSAELANLGKSKLEVDEGNLHAKFKVQEAFATGGHVASDWLADALDLNLRFRKRCSQLASSLENSVTTARTELRSLGERPVGGHASGDHVPNWWREDFASARRGNDALLRALQHPDAGVGAVPPCALEERCDANWRFLLELVGLLEKLPACPQGEVEALCLELERRLSALLDCKRQLLEAEMQGSKPDLELVKEETVASQKIQTRIWQLLTARNLDLTAIVPTKFAEEMLPHPAAFGRNSACDRTDEYEYPAILRVLSYNLFIRAPSPKFFQGVGNEKKDDRLSRFCGRLADYDVLLLQEIVGSFSQRREWLIARARELGFRDVHKSSTDVFPQHLIDSGLLILSRLPMVGSLSLTFEPCWRTDRLAARGALLSRLRLGPRGPYLWACTAHLQDGEDGAAARQRQLGQLCRFLAEHSTGEPLLLGACLNVNGRRCPADAGDSDEYLEAMAAFRALGACHDLLRDSLGSQPVTFADTWLSAKGELPSERVLTEPAVYNDPLLRKRRLDYLLFFPAGQSLVPASCRLEKFLVDRSKQVGAPVTQLSTHYGIEATMALIEATTSSVPVAPAVLPDAAELLRDSATSPKTEVEPTIAEEDAQDTLASIAEAHERSAVWSKACDGSNTLHEFPRVCLGATLDD